MDAHAKSVQLQQKVPPKEKGGEPTVIPVAASDLVDIQANFAVGAPKGGGEKQIGPMTKGAQAIIDTEAGAKGVLATLDGLDKLHSARKGAAAIQIYKFAADDTGYVANRTVSLVDAHPEAFEHTNLEQAKEQGGKFAQMADSEVQGNVQARFSHNALDFGAAVSNVLKKSWSGKEVTAQEAVVFGMNVSREMERAVSPLPPDAQHKHIQWVEDATIDLLSVWPGNIVTTAKAAGLKIGGDPKELAALEQQAREVVLGGQHVEANRTLGGVLGLAGVDASKAEHQAQARALLQDVPLDEVPVSLAKGIVAHHKLPEDKIDWLAGRIVDLGGRPGNVGGLAAEIEKMLPPPKPAG